MPKVETRTREIVARLEKDGWVNIGGGSHDRFVSERRPGVMITVPRHKELSSGVAAQSPKRQAGSRRP